MIDRRRLLLATVGLSTSYAGAAYAQPSLTDDGLYTQPWFLDSFLHLTEDLDAATKAGKRFAIMWELRGLVRAGAFRDLATQYHRGPGGDGF